MRWNLVLLTVLFLCCSAFAEKKPGTGAIEPLRVPFLDNQMYVGYQYTKLDYALRSSPFAPSATDLTTNGLNIEYAYRKKDHLTLLGTARYGYGNLMNQRLLTVGAGAGYVLFWRRYEPFVQLMAGYSRLNSSHNAGNTYLYEHGRGGFTTLVGAGMDVSLSQRWGVRPIYVESQYLPFGMTDNKGSSVYWNAGAGILFRFGHSRSR
jgi:hypothetical protein